MAFYDEEKKLLEFYYSKLNNKYARAKSVSMRKKIARDLHLFSTMCQDEFEGVLSNFNWDNDYDINDYSKINDINFFNYINENKELYRNISDSVIKTYKEVDMSLYKDYFKIFYCDYPKLTKEEMNKIKVDFIKSYDEYWYEVIMKHINDSLIYSGFLEDYGGCVYSYSSLGKNFVFTSEEYGDNILSCCNYIHEYGHIYEIDLTNNSKLIDNFNKMLQVPFYEISSSFFEYAFIMYLKENKIYEKSVNQYLHYFYLKLLKFNARMGMLTKLSEEETYGDIPINNELINEYNHIQEELNFYEILPEEELQFKDEFVYGLGTLFAVHLYENYRQDKEYFKKEFKNSLLSYPIIKDLSAFNNVGITKEELLNGNVLKKVLKNNMN